jgi:hypothetical protein
MSKEPVPRMSFSGYTEKRKIPVWLIATIVVLIALAIGSGIFTYLRYTTLSQPAAKTPAPPAATGTPLVGMSVTQLYQYVTSKTPSLTDPLDGSQPGNWDNGPGCQFKQKALSLTVSPSLPEVICFLRNEFVRDFAFQVQVQFGSTTDLDEQQGCAILFRAHLVQQESYGFNVNTISMFDPITVRVATLKNASLDINNSEGTVTELKSWSQGLPDHMNSPNVLTVIVVHSQINLYINTQPQLRITNTAFQGGQIGLVSNSTFTLFRGTFEVAFRDMKLWIL